MRLLPVLLFLIASVAECLKLNRVLIPPYKSFGEDAVLKCEFDLGRDLLYAVKWYKDNEEFFRYVPRYNPPIYTHTVEGVRVDTARSNDKRVLLRGLTVRSSGGYRCEVSAEAPSFSSIIGEGRMTVVYLPKDPPQITGQLRAEYEVGNVLDLNCTSPKSFPPAKLSWYINDSPIPLPPDSFSIYHAVESPPLEGPPPQGGQNKPVYGGMGGGGWTTPTTAATQVVSSLMVSALRLQLTLESHHFGPKGTARLRCVARIPPLFWQDGNEQILSRGGSHGGEHHRPQGAGSNPQQHQTRHGRKKTMEEVNFMEEELEEGHGEEERGEGEENRGAHQNRFRNSYGNNNYHGSQHRGATSHQGTYQTQSRHRGSGGHPPRQGYRGEEQDYGEEEEEEEEQYGFGLPTFQKEALVLVRGAGCSSLKPAAVSVTLAKILTLLPYILRWESYWKY